MEVALRQIRGNSGIDVWAETLCNGINQNGHHCSIDLLPGYLQFMPLMARFWKNRSHPDIVHSSTWNGFALREDVPLVITEHHVIMDPSFDQYRTLPQKLFDRWIYFCERKSYSVADAVTCDCEYTRKKVEEVFGYMDSQVVYPGIDHSLFRPVCVQRTGWKIPEDRTVLFFAGNLSRRKGADMLPAIMNYLGDDYLLLVTSGQKQGSVMGCRNIINLGNLSLAQLIETYNVCDIFLSPSRLEGFGLSIAEAMACGKPVVATNCSSIPELIIDGKGGFLCQIDNVKDFAEKISPLAFDEEMRTEMGIFNRNRVEELFSIKRMTGNYLKLYASLL